MKLSLFASAISGRYLWHAALPLCVRACEFVAQKSYCEVRELAVHFIVKLREQSSNSICDFIYLIYQWLSDSRWGCAPHTYIVERAARIARVTRFNSPILFSISMRKKNIQWAEKILLRLTVVQTVRFHISFDLQGFLPREKLSFVVVADTGCGLKLLCF